MAAVWHTPTFLVSGTRQSAWGYWPFFLGVVAISVILTAMFNAARDRLLVAVLFHTQMNCSAWPDAQPWDMYLFAAVAVVVVLLNRKAMLSREGAATETVLPDVVEGVSGRTINPAPEAAQMRPPCRRTLVMYAASWPPRRGA